jgi:hypothetical protein
MLHYKSKPDDIIHYINQLELLLLSEKEKSQIHQIMSLETLIKDNSIKGLIAEDLKDEDWINSTQILINTCHNRITKTLKVQNHIEECKNFIVYRFLEEKANRLDIEIYKQISGWNFNEVEKNGEKNKWVSQKFMRIFSASNVQREFEQLLKLSSVLTINQKWLHENRNIFFTENIFSDLNFQVKKQVELTMF